MDCVHTLHIRLSLLRKSLRSKPPRTATFHLQRDLNRVCSRFPTTADDYEPRVGDRGADELGLVWWGSGVVRAGDHQCGGGDGKSITEAIFLSRFRLNNLLCSQGVSAVSNKTVLISTEQLLSTYTMPDIGIP